VLPEATNSRVPSGLRSSADGCRPAAIAARRTSRRPPSAGANAVTVLPPQLLTNTVPFGATTTPYG
jgi:hypothetical protein